MNLPPLLMLCIAMLAFAANSLLCRLALGVWAMDPVSFTSLRIVSGALLLAVLHIARGGVRHWRFEPLSALALYAYAILFSLAYVSLPAGTGALLLFSAVQLTMLSVAIARGERPSALAWTGFGAAVLGVVVLLKPGLAMPAPAAAAMMLGAGVAWGVYTLRGARGHDPVAATTWNFVAAAPLAVIVSLSGLSTVSLNAPGIVAALASGMGASALGYVVWYRVLPRLTGTLAATAQLSVPLLAAVGGALLLHEPLGLRLAISSVLILGGIALVVRARQRR